MSRYDDPVIRDQARHLGGKVMRAIREAKRLEAAERNEATAHRNTRAHREGRCGCPEAPARARCPYPDKVAYTTPQDAAYALGKHGKHRRWKSGLNVYRCPAGHYHAGRWRNGTAAWEKAA